MKRRERTLKRASCVCYVKGSFHQPISNLGVKEGNVDCIPKNEEIYISFSKEVVVDSYLEKAEGKENANENVKCFLLNVNAKCFLFLLFQLTEAKLFVSGAD